MGRVILVLIIVAGLIWGLSSAECPKCDGSGEFSRQVEHKNDCFVCKGRGELKCSWQTSWTDKGFAWNLGNYEHRSRNIAREEKFKKYITVMFSLYLTDYVQDAVGLQKKIVITAQAMDISERLKTKDSMTRSVLEVEK